jgi:hypothetical protein
MNRKFLYITLGCLLSAGVMKAQNYPKNEISVSYGFINQMEIANTFGKCLEIWATAGAVSRENEHNTGSLNLDYTHNFSKLIGIGFNASLSQYKCDCRLLDETGRQKDTYFAFMPTMKINWMRRKFITLYSKVALGIITDHSRQTDTENGETKTNNDCHFGYQASPIGIEIGNAIAGFAEAGLGQAGTLQIGIRAKL